MASKHLSDYGGSRTGRSFQDNPLTQDRCGGFLSNRDNAYIFAAADKGAGSAYVVRGRAPQAASQAHEAPNGSAQIRYWSLCTNEFFTQRFVTVCTTANSSWMQTDFSRWLLRMPSASQSHGRLSATNHLLRTRGHRISPQQEPCRYFCGLSGIAKVRGTLGRSNPMPPQRARNCPEKRQLTAHIPRIRWHITPHRLGLPVTENL